MEGPYCQANVTKLAALDHVCATFFGFQRDAKDVTVLHNLYFKNLLLLVQILMVFRFYPG